MKNTGMMPTAFKKMVARLAGTDIEEADENQEEEVVDDDEENEEADEGAEEEDGTNDGDDANDADDEGANEEEADNGQDDSGRNDLKLWLEAQEVMTNEGEACTDKFSITVVDGQARLFNGHDCGSELDYTLISKIQFPFGTWASSYIT